MDMSFFRFLRGLPFVGLVERKAKGTAFWGFWGGAQLEVSSFPENQPGDPVSLRTFGMAKQQINSSEKDPSCLCERRPGACLQAREARQDNPSRCTQSDRSQMSAVSFGFDTSDSLSR